MRRFAILVILLMVTGLSNIKDPVLGAEARYLVKRLDQPFTVDADWNKPIWQNVPPLGLTHFMGDRPQHFPRTEAKLLYDDSALYVIFRVEDRYVRAVAKAHQGEVFNDSCVEFFFIPAANTTTAYFNLEMNCGGTMLLHYQTIPVKTRSN